MSGTVERDLDVVVVCEINVDIVVTGLSGPPDFGAERLVDAVTLTAGSSGVLAATGMADLGLHVGVCGLVGDDPFGRYMLDHLDHHGIDRGGVVVDPAERTGAGVLLSTPHDRAILTFAGAMAHFALSQVRVDVVARARHLHLSSYFLQQALQPDVPTLLARAHELGLTTSADTGHDPAEIWQIDGLLEGLDVFLPNEVEARAITGAATAAEALERLLARVPTVAVKRGAAGALAGHGSERVDVPGFAVEAIDTTGAGDAFDAGFLAGLLAGEELAACVRRGNACGALTAVHVGGSGGFDRARVEAVLRSA
jgi:sugar/nucleoside kinase (ribokinase family)